MDKAQYFSQFLVRLNGRPIDISQMTSTYPGMPSNTWYRKTVGSGYTVFYYSVLGGNEYTIEIDINISPCIQNPPNSIACIRFTNISTGTDLAIIDDGIAISSIDSVPINNIDYTIFLLGGAGILIAVLLFDKLFQEQKPK